MAHMAQLLGASRPSHLADAEPGPLLLEVLRCAGRAGGGLRGGDPHLLQLLVLVPTAVGRRERVEHHVFLFELPLRRRSAGPATLL